MFVCHSLYEVSFPNDLTEELTENVIAENMLSQVDSYGHHYQLLKDISEHPAGGSALNRIGGFIINIGRNLNAKKKTRGWKIGVLWKYGDLSWIPLKDVKTSDPVEPSEYAAAKTK